MRTDLLLVVLLGLTVVQLVLAVVARRWLRLARSTFADATERALSAATSYRRASSTTTDLTADLARAMTSMCPQDQEVLRRVLVVHAQILSSVRDLPDDTRDLTPPAQ